jgi:hypothetical protein
MKHSPKNFDHFDASPVVLIILLLGFLLARFAAPVFRLLPPCTFHTVFKLPCPTCGATRAGLALAQGHALEALTYNPLFVIGLIVLLTWSGTRMLAQLTGRFISGSAWKERQKILGGESDHVQHDLRRRAWLRGLAIGAMVLNWLYLMVTT